MYGVYNCSYFVPSVELLESKHILIDIHFVCLVSNLSIVFQNYYSLKLNKSN